MKYWRDFLFILILFALSFLFFGQGLGLAEKEMLIGKDLHWLFYPTTEFAFNAFRQQGLPTWNPYLFLGFPQYAEPQLSTFYPLLKLLSPLPVSEAFSILYAFHFGLSASGGYVLVRQMGGKRSGAFLAGFVLAFGAFMSTHFFAGHLPHIMTIAYLPWLLAAAYWAIKPRPFSKMIAATMIAAAPLALAILAGYAPFFPFLVASVSLLMLWMAFINWRQGNRGDAVRILGQWLGLGIFAGLLAAVQLLPTLEFTLYSSRVSGVDYAFNSKYHLPFWQFLTLLTPDLFGVPQLYTLPTETVSYWAETSIHTYWETAVYVGILPLLFWVLSWFIGRRQWWFWSIMGLAGLLLALGSVGGWYQFFYELVPGFSLFRAPGRMGYFFLLSAAVLTGLMFDRWFDLPQAEFERWRSRLTKLLIIMLPLFFATILLSVVLQAAAIDSEASQKLHGLTDQFVRAALLLSASVALLIGGYGRSRWLVTGAASILLLFDLWGFGGKFITTTDSQPQLGWIMADLILPPERHEFRLMSADLSKNSGYFFGFQHVDGYDDFRTETGKIFASLAQEEPRVARLLGVRYILHGEPGREAPDAAEGWSLLTAPAGVTIYEGAESSPRAFMVHDVLGVETAAESLQRLKQADIDLTQTAVVEVLPNTYCDIEDGDPAANSVKITRYEPQSIEIEVEAAANGWLVLTDLYYPGWRAAINGRSVPIQPTNYALRGICVPQGKHTVLFYFDPPILRAGMWVSIIAVGLLALALVWMLIPQPGRKKA